MNTEELRYLAEQAGESSSHLGLFHVAANPAAILSLLDELDRSLDEQNHWIREYSTAEQRVAALDEGLRLIGEEACDALSAATVDGLPAALEDIEQRVRQLLQASAQDASEGSGTDG